LRACLELSFEVFCDQDSLRRSILIIASVLIGP
jgi:hypothetical protein